MNKRNNTINRKGFTLIELLAVIVVLAIVLVVTIPSVLSSMGSAKNKQFENAKKIVEKYMTTQYEICKSGVSDLTKDYNKDLFNENNCTIKDTVPASAILKAAGISEEIIESENFGYEFVNGEFTITKATPGSAVSKGGTIPPKRKEGLSFIRIEETLADDYDSLTPQNKLLDDTKRAANWFNEQLENDETGKETSQAYENWITTMGGGSFPTCPTSSEEDLKNCFYHFTSEEDTLGLDVLEAIGIGNKGIQVNSYHTMAFINESTNKICVMLKIDNNGGSYYETDYTTDFGNIRYMESSGC